MKFITGVNYWPKNKGLAMWRDFDIREIAGDMEAIAKLGMNAVRLFLRWSDFQPEPDRIDRTMMDRFEQVLEAAKTNGVPTVPVTETLPDGQDYLSWMKSNIQALTQALGG